MSPTIKTNSVAAWILASRPKTLGAIYAPVAIGGALAYSVGQFSAPIFLATLLCSWLLQIMANLVNDYGDHARGSDTNQRLGPPRAMANGWLTPFVMKVGILVVFMLASALGLFLVNFGGMPVFIIGFLSLLMCFWYTAGPRPLSYLGFSEVFVLLFFGPLPVLGTIYLQTMTFSSMGLMASLAPACLSTALIMTNNLRDFAEDQRHHKKTLAVRFGAPFSRHAIAILLFAAALGPVLLVVFFGVTKWIVLSDLALLLPLTNLSVIYEPVISRRYNQMLAAIGISLYLFGSIMAIALVYGQN